MPKGYARGAACKTCGSTGTKHKAGCAEDGGKPAAKAKPLGMPARGSKGPDLAGYTVTQLLALIVAAQAELERREQDLKEQLDAIRTARAA